jgi:MFS transporter, SHS family, lactate transporter
MGIILSTNPHRERTFGTIPARLNGISPPEATATFPGFTYQFGNFLAAGNATVQVACAR